MPDELLFTVTGSTAVSATPISLSEAGLQERVFLPAEPGHTAMYGLNGAGKTRILAALRTFEQLGFVVEEQPSYGSGA